MSKKVPLLEEVLKYKKENNLILSMPGNKSGIGFLRDDIGKEFALNMGFLDITEVDPLDNLHAPEGIIKEAQELLAETYGVKKAYFVVNGSTAGNLASIFDAFNEGDEVLVERNCHKSVYNGLILRKLKVKYIEPVIHEDKGLFLPPTEKEIYKALDRCNNARGIILTYPNYFGIGYDIFDTLKDLKERGLTIIIDGAHGAHYGISERLPKSIVSYADYIVLSAHKTLPSLTQGSYLLVNNDKNVDFYLKAFMTTSPSYLIMSSLDYSRYYLDNYGEKDYDKLIGLANKWSIKINTLNKVSILKEEDLPAIWEELDMEPAVKVQNSLKNVEMCPANYCKRSKYPTIGIGMKISKNFHGMQLPCRTKIGVAGCKNACTSVYSKDIGVLVDLDKKFYITAGGSAGYYPRSSDLVTKGLSEEEAFKLVKTILYYYKDNAQPGEKLGDFIDRISIDTFREEVLNLASLELQL